MNEYSKIANDGLEDKQFGNSGDGCACSNGSNYHAITYHNRKSGGQDVLCSLSNAQSLELLGHSGEVHSLTLLLNLLIEYVPLNTGVLHAICIYDINTYCSLLF